LTTGRIARLTNLWWTYCKRDLRKIPISVLVSTSYSPLRSSRSSSSQVGLSKCLNSTRF